MATGEAKVFVGMGGNFALAAPDTQLVFQGLRNCNLTVHVSTKLNRSHLIHGKTALILPCLGRTEIDKTMKREQMVSTEDTAGSVAMSNVYLESSASHEKREVAIVCGMAIASIKGSSKPNWTALAEDYDLIRHKINSVLDASAGYNTRIKNAGGFYLPNCNRDG